MISLSSFSWWLRPTTVRPSRPVAPSATAAACAVCGIHTDADPSLLVDRSPVSLWRVCGTCQALREPLAKLGAQIGAQWLLILADAGLPGLTDADLPSALPEFAFGWQHAPHESAPGSAGRWGHLDLSAILRELEFDRQAVEQASAGLPVPPPYAACGGCGAVRSVSWRPGRLGHPSKAVQICDSCIWAIRDLRVTGDTVATVPDRIAAVAAGLDELVVRLSLPGPAERSGFRLFCETPGAKSGNAFEYLSDDVRKLLVR